MRPGERVIVGRRWRKLEIPGNTTEPHLHIHAKRGGWPDSMLDGGGVATRFAGKWLIRNSIVHGLSGKSPIRASAENPRALT